jgi:nucleoid-associated protein YgaU
MKRLTWMMILTAFVGLGAKATIGHPARPVKAVVYVVRPGDTLWNIAASLGGDRRESIYTIEQANRLDSGGIWVGQHLILPAH